MNYVHGGKSIVSPGVYNLTLREVKVSGKKSVIPLSTSQWGLGRFVFL